MPNFINMYFAICLIAWFVDVIAFVVIIAVKPLRKWCWKKYKRLAYIFYKLAFELAEDMESLEE